MRTMTAPDTLRTNTTDSSGISICVPVGVVVPVVVDEVLVVVVVVEVVIVGLSLTVTNTISTAEFPLVSNTSNVRLW